ncbi:hypothetical protein ACWEQ0_25660 [Nocardia thailandica]
MNGILYMSQFASSLDRDEARRVAHNVVARPMSGAGADGDYSALLSALKSSEELDVVVRVPHSADTVRRFLELIVEELDQLRPWPHVPFEKIPSDRWPEFSRRRPIAVVSVSWPTIQGRIGRMFEDLGGGCEGVLARTSGGIEVALVWPSHTGRSAVDVISRESDDVGRVIAEIVADTTLEPEEIRAI